MHDLDMITLSVLQTTFIAYILSIMSPGPNILLVLRAAAVETKYTNVLALALGIATGTAVWLVLTLLGLTKLIGQYKTALFIVQLLGVAYFIYLGIDLLISKKNANSSASQKSTGSVLENYLTGAVFNLSNIRTALFFLTLLGPVMARIQSVKSLSIVCLAIFLISCSWQILLTGFYFLRSYNFKFVFKAHTARYALSICFFALAIQMFLNIFK